MLQKLSGMGGSFCNFFDYDNFFHESYPKSGANVYWLVTSLDSLYK